MTPIHGTVLAVSLLLCLLRALAETLHVPEEYNTIQAALDSTSAWDTVLVAPGTYHEFLISPNHSFVLSGWHPADTATIHQTLLDPIPELGIDTPSVFLLTSDTAVIVNFAFFNRQGLREVNLTTRSGAFENYTNYLQVSHCTFDSVSSAIWGGQQIVVERCTFRGCVGQCILPQIDASVRAHDCYFEGSGNSLVTAFSNSRFDDCTFACNLTGGHFIDIYGSHVLITRCKFGPCVGGFWVANVVPVSDVIIENSLFEGLDRVYSVLAIGVDCRTTGALPITIRNNVFRDNHTVEPATGVIAIDLQCAQQSEGFLGSILDNTFVNCDATNATTPGIHTLRTSVNFDGNTFIDLDPESRPDILAEGSSQDTLYARNNSFLPPGLAASTAGSYFDARENWWGDSTGPYNINENPEGRGSEVASGVLFVPWLTHHPDSTTDTTHISIEEPADIQKSSFSLATFPNPFNSTVTIEYTLTHEQDVILAIYDLLGRQVETLFSERQGIGGHSVQWNADHYASGLYFARLTLSESNSATQVVKLLLMK